MLDRPEAGNNAIIVHINFRGFDSSGDLAEFKILASSAGANVVGDIEGSRQKPDPRYFVGSGKAEEIRQLVEATQADLVLVDHSLSPSQERNMEGLIECRVLDRAGLILDIFAQRARTFEGKLQVELAQLQHLSTRLVRGWTHLERQKGGIGLRGPGETQLETDRRLLRDRISLIKKRLEKVRSQRGISRRARNKAAMPTVSLVGYTNAGKSTLFNQLTKADVYTANQLFATLDPTLRRVEVPYCGDVVLADTVGFIRYLPHDLIEAFRATLEETQQAGLLLHVIDAVDPERRENIDAVEKVLKEVGAENVPQLLVYNKIDLLSKDSVILGADQDSRGASGPRIDYGEDGLPTRVWISAEKGLGLDLLLKAISERLAVEPVYCCVKLLAKESELRAKLYEKKAVIDEQFDEQGNCFLEIKLRQGDWQRLFS